MIQSFLIGINFLGTISMENIFNLRIIDDNIFSSYLKIIILSGLLTNLINRGIFELKVIYFSPYMSPVSQL